MAAFCSAASKKEQRQAVELFATHSRRLRCLPQGSASEQLATLFLYCLYTRTPQNPVITVEIQAFRPPYYVSFISCGLCQESYHASVRDRKKLMSNAEPRIV